MWWYYYCACRAYIIFLAIVFFFYFCPILYSHGRFLVVPCTRFASAICSVLGLRGAALPEKCPPPPSTIQQDNFLIRNTTAEGNRLHSIASKSKWTEYKYWHYIVVEQSILQNGIGTHGIKNFCHLYTNSIKQMPIIYYSSQ